MTTTKRISLRLLILKLRGWFTRGAYGVDDMNSHTDCDFLSLNLTNYSASPDPL